MMELSERSQFGFLLDTLGLKGDAVEIGVATGRHAKQIVSYSAVETLYLIDSWEQLKQHGDGAMPQFWHDDNLRQTIANVTGYDHKVIILKGKSADMISKIPDNSLIFAYLDGDHSYDGCFWDLVDIYPKLKKGGVLAGHDFLNIADYGVNKAVSDFINIHLFNEGYLMDDVHVTGEEDKNDASFWLIKK